MLSTLTALVLVTAAQPPAPPPLSEGGQAYQYRCKGCHEPPTPGAPGRDTLTTWKPETIVRALTSGEMKPYGAGLSPADMRAIAAFITSKPMPAERGLPEAKP